MDTILQILILLIEFTIHTKFVSSELSPNVKISRFRSVIENTSDENSSSEEDLKPNSETFSTFKTDPTVFNPEESDNSKPSPVLAKNLQGTQQISRIAHGFSAVDGQFPWSAALLVVNNNRVVAVGGGNVISDEWILTAGHCIVNALVVTVTLGTVDRFKANVRQWSTQFVVHPLYEPMTLNNDIGLIKLPEKLTFTELIQPAPLPTQALAREPLINEVALVNGFGITETSGQGTQFLRFTFVRIISNSQCAQRYTRSIIRDTTICSVGFQDERRSICAGDSGNGLLVFKNRVWTLFGIASFTSNQGCGANLPSGYLRVSPYLNWISQITHIPVS